MYYLEKSLFGCKDSCTIKYKKNKCKDYHKITGKFCKCAICSYANNRRVQVM